MKIDITGASHFVNRMFEACGRFQWAREFLQNSLEAKATRVHFGIEWQAVKNAGVYRRTIIDNGHGMDADELLMFFSKLGAGAKRIAGIHDNFGVGAKVASLPWNTYGIVIVSYKNGLGSMIWIRLDESTGEYELVDYETDSGVVNVIEPEDCTDQEGEWCDWSSLRPSWLKENGTIIVLLGKHSKEDTILGNPQSEEKTLMGLSLYLNSRFWNLKDVNVSVAELRTDKKMLWPKEPYRDDGVIKVTNRQIWGARHWLTKSSGNGKLAYSGTIYLKNDRIRLEWYLWEGERPSIHAYARETGYIAVKYKEELFEITNRLHDFRAFGILEKQVRKNLTIIIKPTLFEKGGEIRWGIHPDQSRNRLLFTGEQFAGDAIPLTDWGAEFASSLPEPIMEAIKAARGEGSGTIEDEKYRKRLMDRFGNRWAIEKFVEKPKSTGHSLNVELSNDKVVVLADFQGKNRKRCLPRSRKTAKKSAIPRNNKEAEGEENKVLQDIPRYRFAHKEDFEHPFHIAAWAPKDPEGPTVLINVDSPILESVVEYHLQRYPSHFAEEIAHVIRNTYGEIAVAKVAHTQKLAKHINLHEIDQLYRSENALTAALMGLIAEESLLTQRLAKYCPVPKPIRLKTTTMLPC
jgi:hypothetical protein